MEGGGEREGNGPCLEELQVPRPEQEMCPVPWAPGCSWESSPERRPPPLTGIWLPFPPHLFIQKRPLKNKQNHVYCGSHAVLEVQDTDSSLLAVTEDK